ncbi:MAG: tRNA 2-thiouridine(34) synthase MnmA [Candidatus Kerfeldbacteria bacterium]|nr:tRNA 2-thiouridine(34) synthase MnmA [Candidatus Kerfeldbacteria bacterium]
MTITQGIAKGKVAVAMSGGVDSAVAAALLLQQGYQVEAFYMKNWSDEADALYRGQHEQCPWEDDVKDVAAICETLGIPFQSINFEKEYRDKVFKYFLEETKAGRTPNPDVLCNTQIKFLSFLDKALELGFDHIATGHYARTQLLTTNYQLLKGLDSNKDQSYFIYHLNQNQLQHILFPIGGLQKSEVRKLAEEFKLPVAKKPDSQGLCFIGDIDFQTFLKQYVKAEPGPMVLVDGTVMGQHKGLAYYTIGQRQGIEIGGTGPYYVVDKRMADNTLVICQAADQSSLLSNWCTFTDEHWVSGQRLAEPFQCSVKVRYRTPDIACTVTGNRVEFTEPARAVTPGQFVVFYDGDTVLGGGVIDQREVKI